MTTSPEFRFPAIPPPSIFGDIMPIVPIPHTAESERFCPVSLRDWITVCQQADIPHVPAQRIAAVQRYSLLYQEKSDQLQKLKEDIQPAIDAYQPHHMVRFDYCSGTAIKYRLSEGQPQWHPDFHLVDYGDPRVFELAMEYPREEIPIWQRPWIPAAIHHHYPVEFRAYVFDGKVTGISNYYPQRPLPESFRRHVDTVHDLAEHLIAATPPPFLWNDSPFLKFFREEHDAHGIHFTADFILHQDGRILFLEGGPPHELGAHPCCFKAFDITGVALSPRYDAEN